MTAGDPSDNPFIRFRNHIDSNIQRGFHTVFGSPTAMVAKTNNNTPTNNLDHNPPKEAETPSSTSEMPDRDRVSTSADVLSWATSSPYSPANLQSLIQPRPNDVPRDYPSCFTFRDAFEDLLAASDGRPLSDLRRLVLVKQFEHFTYSPWGMPVEDWVNSIGRQGLWGSYFPLSPSAKRELSYGLVSPWVFQTKERIFNQPQTFPWPKTAFPRWESHSPRTDPNWIGHSEESSRDEARATQHRDADTEEALYTNIPPKSVTGSRVGIDLPPGEPTNDKSGSARHPHSSDSETAPISQTVETPSGGKILKTYQQRTYGAGVETRTTTQQFDADGNLIAQGEETSWTWSHAFPKRPPSLDDKGKAGSDVKGTTSSSVTGEASIRGNGKVSGWFWTR